MVLCLQAPVDPLIAQIGWHPGTFSRSSTGMVSAAFSGRALSLRQKGWDIMADVGAPVLAGLGGMVTTVGHSTTEASATNVAPGWHVVVRTDVAGDRPIWTNYWHLAAQPRVVLGQQVAAGDLLGFLGSSGLPSGARPHLLLSFSRFGPDPLRDLPSDINPAMLNFRVEGAQQPPVRVGDWERTPAFGGRFISTCQGELGEAPTPRNNYGRYGRTRLSNTRPYDPAGGERRGWGVAPLFGVVFVGAVAFAHATVRRSSN